MRIEVADAKQLGITALVGAAIGKDDWSEKKEYNSEELKKSPDGRTIHTTRKAMLWMDEQGEEVRDLSISVIEPSEAKAAGRVQLAGKAWVTHWIKGGKGGERAQLGVSVVVERLEPVRPGSDV